MNHLLIGYVEIPRLSMVSEEDIRRLDVINLAFAHVQEGRVVCDALSEARCELDRIRSVNPELKLVLSVGGWGAGGFSEAASTPEGRTMFARTAARLAAEHDLDGIDVDWEYPCISTAGIKASDRDDENFTLLLQRIRQELDEAADRHRLLTIAGGGDGYYTRCTKLDEAVPYLDYVQLMSYDLRGGYTIETGHHTNLYGNRADFSEASTQRGVELYLQAGVPREKLVIGAAFYSRMWKGVPDAGHGWMQMAETTGGYGPGYGELLDSYINKNGYVRYWDDEAKAAFLYNGDTFISYDDPEALAAKAEYVKEQGLLGVMFWEYSCDTSRTLVKVLADGLGKEKV